MRAWRVGLAALLCATALMLTDAPSAGAGPAPEDTEADSSAEIRGWVDTSLTLVGLVLVGVGGYLAIRQYKDQKRKDRDAERDRAANELRRSLLEEPRCNPNVHAHLIAGQNGHGFLLDAEVELESRSEARIDFVYGDDEPRCSIQVFSLSESVTADLTHHIVDHDSPLIKAPIDLGDLIDPDECVSDSVLISLPLDADVIAYLVLVEITVVQSARLQLHEQETVASDEQTSAKAPIWVLSDKVVVPGPNATVVASATDGPGR